jgi:outer membrane protein assembly factor BamA
MKIFKFAFFSFFLLFANFLSGQVVNEIVIVGNEKTEESLIIYELGLSEGMEIPIDNLEKWINIAENRLMNTSLFLEVNIGFINSKDGINLTINVRERWYYWLYPILEHADRNFASFIHQREWDRINYGLSFEKHNLRGRNELLKLKARLGYREQLGVLYDNPALNRNRKHGIQLSYDRFRQRKNLMGIVDNQPVYFYDDAKVAISENRLRLIYSNRPFLHHRIDIMFEYQKFEISDDYNYVRPDYLYQNDLLSKFISVYMKYSMDFLDDKFYPLKGNFIELKLAKHGVGIFNANIDLLTFSLDASNYFQINQRWNLSNELFFKSHLMNKNNIPFYFSFILGFKHYPRGFEYYIYQGNMSVGINETLKYQLFRTIELPARMIPIAEFRPFEFTIYAIYFVDFAHVRDSELYSDSQNEQNNSVLISTGIGLDFVTYYDRSFGIHLAMTNQKAFGIFAELRTPLYKTF